jgi:hypothetical protein
VAPIQLHTALNKQPNLRLNCTQAKLRDFGLLHVLYIPLRNGSKFERCRPRTGCLRIVFVEKMWNKPYAYSNDIIHYVQHETYLYSKNCSINEKMRDGVINSGTYKRSIEYP